MKSTGWVVAIVGVGLVFTGGLAKSVFAAPDPCSVLTMLQLSDALGVPVADGKHLATTACQWTPAGAPSANGKKLTVTFQEKRVRLRQDAGAQREDHQDARHWRW